MGGVCWAGAGLGHCPDLRLGTASLLLCCCRPASEPARLAAGFPQAPLRPEAQSEEDIGHRLHRLQHGAARFLSWWQQI